MSFSLLCLNVVISELKICWFCQLWLWPVIKELKDVFQPILHFKGLIRDLSEEFWSELSQRGDQGAQTLAFYFLSLTAVIKELKNWFWPTISHSSDQWAQEGIDLSNSSFSSDHSDQAFIFLLTVSQSSDQWAQKKLTLTTLYLTSDHRPQTWSLKCWMSLSLSKIQSINP